MKNDLDDKLEILEKRNFFLLKILSYIITFWCGVIIAGIIWRIFV